MNLLFPLLIAGMVAGAAGERDRLKAEKKQRRRGAPMAPAGTYAYEMVPVQARTKKRKAGKKR